jgi:hypothetical protein
MMSPHAPDCDFPAEWLVAWRDRQLQGAPAELAETHVATCAICRRRLREMDDVDHLLREATPLDGHPALRQRIRERVEDAPAPGDARIAPLLRARLAAASLSLLLLAAVLVGLLLPGPLAEGGSTLTRWLTSDRTLGRVLPGSRDARRIVPPTGAVTPTGLPFGLGLAQETETERIYRNDAGLALSLTNTPADGSGAIALPDTPGASEIVGVAGRDVLVLFGQTRETVAAASWQEDEQLRVLFVLLPSGGLGLDDTLAIVEALMRAEQGE